MKNNAADFLEKIRISRKAYPRIGRIVIALIIAQSCLAPIISVLLLKDPNKNLAFYNLDTAIAYTTIVLCILVLPRKNLSVFYDRFSLSLIAIACLARPLFFSGNGLIYNVVMISLGIALLFFIRVNQKKIEIPSLNSVLIGLAWSVSTVTAISLIRVFSNTGPNPEPLPADIGTFIFNSAISDLTFIVLEEAYYRGLLFGLLVMNGWKEDKALLAQGLLFWGSHYLYVGDPVFFLVMIPLMTISTTLITRKYKMLYLSIMIHIMNNVFTGMLVGFFSRI